MKEKSSNNFLDNFYNFLNKHLGEVLTSLEIPIIYKINGKKKTKSQTKFTDDEICKNPAKWSKFLSIAIEETISNFLVELNKEKGEKYELISSKTDKEFLVDIILVKENNVKSIDIKYTGKEEGRKHKKPVDIYKEIDVAVEYEWDIGKDGCHFFTRDFPKLSHIKANYYMLIYLNPKRFEQTKNNLNKIINELNFELDKLLIVELSRDDQQKILTINRITFNNGDLTCVEGSTIKCNQSR